MIEAVAYVRVSSNKQDVARQKVELKSYAKDMGFSIIKTYEDVISSTKKSLDERQAFTQLKNKLLKDDNEIKHLFVHEISRLGRKTVEVLTAIDDFSKHQINIHFKDQKLSTLDENGVKSLDSSLIISVLSSMAENETRLLGQRIRSGLLNNARKGMSFSDKIIGYDKADDGRPVINDEQSKWVRKMYELAANETSIYFIQKELEKEFDKTLNTKTISGIIKNPFYKGERMYLNEVINVDAIVSSELWKQANDFLLKRKKFTAKQHKFENIVEGRITCDVCRSTMHQIVISKARCNIFKCSNKKCGTSVNRPWLYEMIRYVVNVHTKKVNDEKFKNDLNIKIKENKILLKKFKIKLSKAQRGIENNYEEYIKETITQSLYKRFSEKLNKEITVLSDSIVTTNNKIKDYKAALKSKPQHFSKHDATFKVQIKDLLHEVEVNKELVRINIGNVLIYKIPIPHPSSIGWHKRKGIAFKNPFESDISIVNVVQDEEIESRIDSYLNEN